MGHGAQSHYYVGMAQASTQLIHHPYTPPEGFQATAPGVHKASTIMFPSVDALRNRDWLNKTTYTYGLNGTPTTFILEERIATLEGGLHCKLLPSGLSALALVNLSFLKAGDELLIPDNAYGPSRELAQKQLAGWGITHQIYDPMQPSDLAAKLNARTRLVWMEAPGSITLEFADVPALVAVVNAHRQTAQVHPDGVVTALDNTWGAGLAFNAFTLGVDVSMQALTKYPSGGGDVLMGSVVTRSPALHAQLKACQLRMGNGISGNDAELVLRGLNTMVMRYAVQDAATRHLAAWMQAQPQVATVLHPALPGSPGHAAWARDCTGAACLFSAVFKPEYSSGEIDAFCERLALFKIGYSWAGPMSLCVPYDIASQRDTAWPHAGRLVRFAIGLEDVQDLQADLAQALHTL